MRSIRTFLLTIAFVNSLVFAGAAFGQTQNGVDATFCKAEIADPDVALQIDLCSAHLGCAMVIKAHKTCTAVRGFAERLGNSIGQGVKTLFGTRKEVQPENIWEAVQTDNTRKLDELPEAKARGSAIREALSKHATQTTERPSPNANVVSYGEVKDGKLQGWGMQIGANGVIERGQYLDGRLEGQGDKFAFGANGAGARGTGEFSAGKMQEGAQVTSFGALLEGRFHQSGNLNLADGKVTFRDGSRWEGRFDSTSALLIQGSKYAANGSLTEKGTFQNGQLHVGERYANGELVASVNRPREQMQQAEAQQASNAERQRREAAEKAASEERGRQEAEAREKKFQSDLASMNAGQLFALADEYRERGDTEKMRQVLRALVTRFPDHPLGREAASLMLPSAAAAPPQRVTAPVAPVAAAAGPRVSSGSRQGSCVRNFNAHDTQLISRGLGIGYSESRAYQESRRLVMAMLAPCLGEDPEARRMHEEARQALEKSEQACNAPGRRAPCPELGRPQDVDYLRDTRESLRLMRSDPNWAEAVESRYAQENQANAGCNAELDRLSRIQREVERRFANSIVAVERLERVMWTLGEAINVLDTKCPQTPVNRLRRDTFHGTLQSIVGTCNAVSSRTCRPLAP